MLAALLISCPDTPLLTEVQQRVQAVQTPVPGAPVISSAIAGVDRVTVAWAPVSGATSYTLYCKQGAAVTPAMYDIKIPGAVSPRIVTGLAFGVQYSFILTAVNSSGESPTSSVARATTNSGVALPQFSPPGGSYTSEKTVTVSCATSGATIRYTDDGSIPSETVGVVYDSPLVISANRTLKAIAYATDMVSSTVAVASYSFGPPAAPVISSAAGGLNKVTVSWGSVSGATSCNLYWKKGAAVTTMSYDARITNAVSPREINSLDSGTRYAFIVTSVGDYGEGMASPVAAAATELQWTGQTKSGSRTWIPVASSADGTRLTAGVSGGYIWTSTDSGANWTAGTSAGSRYWGSVASSADGMKLAACVYGGSIWTSANGGAGWFEQLLAGTKDWTYVASNSDGTKLAACVDGGDIWTSTDSGVHWTDQTLSGAKKWYAVASSSDGMKLAACTYPGDIWTSTYGGVNWTNQTSADSKYWFSIASSDDGTKLAACVYEGDIYTSVDGGAHWTDQPLAGARLWRSIASSADGTMLAACVDGGDIWASTDGGVHWVDQTLAGQRAWSGIASSSDGMKLAACVYGEYIYTSQYAP
jgi:hypothetical protein